MLFCDLSKAFDRVWHKGLIFKLQSYGIGGNLLKWFESYLSGRSQRVLHKNTMSMYKFLNAGVPQGSALGPILFLIYVIYVAEKMSSLCRMYADDNSIQHCSTNIHDIESVINNDLYCLDMWSKQCLLKFNPLKTKAILFSTRKNLQFPFLKFQDCALDFVSSHIHLGITLSQDLGWSTYINSIIANANKKIGLLKKLQFKVSR